MIRTTVLRALVLTAAFAAGLTPVTCLGENSNRLPTKATKELPPELLSLLRQKKMPKYSPIVVRVFKEEAELEVWKVRPGSFLHSWRCALCRSRGPPVRQYFATLWNSRYRAIADSSLHPPDVILP
jgi:murein L,D-transpeptidase YafK